MNPVKPCPVLGGDVDLAADDGLDTFRLAGPVEVDGPVHNAMVGDRYGGLAQFLDPSRQAADFTESVQQAVFCMDVEVYERHSSPLSPPPKTAL